MFKIKIEENNINYDILTTSQKALLYSEIKRKTLHEKLYRATGNELVSIKDSSTWLQKGNNRARHEGAYCYLQDRNVFLGAEGLCPHCRIHKKTVDHLATRCDRMLGHDYMRRHNEVVRCLHLQLCIKYGFKRSKKIYYSVQEIIENENAEIRVDTRVLTDIKVQHNKPDILVHDKKKNWSIIEVGITNQDLLNVVENEKLRKYDLLANELGMVHKCKTKIIPYVMTWDGVVTTYHKKYLRELGIQPNIEAYIQSLVLKKTLESISLDRRRGRDEEWAEEETESVIGRLVQPPGEPQPTEVNG
jgi:hypothetical protein